MSTLDKIMEELDEIYIVKHITQKHDEARMNYRLSSITVISDQEFDSVIGDYYNYHHSKCVAPGAKLSDADAKSRAKEIVFGAYRNQRKDKLQAYADGKNGTNGGMREILDIILNGMKYQAVESHMRDVIDRYVSPSGFDEKVSIVRQLLGQIDNLPSYINRDRPEQYASDYEELIKGLVESINALIAKLRHT